jgi:hypothetical protein
VFHTIRQSALDTLIDLEYGSYHSPNLEIGLTEGVTGQQGMIIPHRHLIETLVYPEVRVCPCVWIVFPTDLTRSIAFPYL